MKKKKSLLTETIDLLDGRDPKALNKWENTFHVFWFEFLITQYKEIRGIQAFILFYHYTNQVDFFHTKKFY